MNRKVMLGIILILLVAFFVFNAFFVTNDSNTLAHTNDSNFKLPDGYSEGKINELGAKNYTKENESIFISESNGERAEAYALEYQNNINENGSIIVKNYTINNIRVFTIENNNTIHYWFVKDNKTYDIYTWDGNNDIELFVNNTIKS